MILITGGAGFIGSCLVGMLNQRGYKDLVIVDNIKDTKKWLNLQGKLLYTVIQKDDLFHELDYLPNLKMIVHLGACSSTSEHDFNYLIRNNLLYSQKLFYHATKLQIPFIYASSAATYGRGEQGYEDDLNLIDLGQLRPINPYGMSKHWFDLWMMQQKDYPRFWAGLKFFNVFGPNEYHKNEMMSLVAKAVTQIQQTGRVKLFQSHRPDIQNGDQKRDFIYVKDVARIMSDMIEILLDESKQPQSGLFNLGTGQARTFKDLADATFSAMNQSCQYEWIPLPSAIQDGYQYFTQANMNKLEIWFDHKLNLSHLEDAVEDYVQGYLLKDRYS